MNAKWCYDKAKRETLLKRMFFLVSLALVFFLPMFVFALPEIVPALWALVLSSPPDVRPGGDVEVVAAQVMAVLTGLMGLHRTIGSWLGQRQLAAAYWETRSRLAEVIYTVESEWGDMAEDEKVNPSTNRLLQKLQQSLRKGIIEGRQIMSEHTASYYQNFRLPEVDVLKTVQEAAPAVQETMEFFKRPRPKPMEAEAVGGTSRMALRDDLNLFADNLEEAGFNIGDAEFQVVGRPVLEARRERVRVTVQVVRHSTTGDVTPEEIKRHLIEEAELESDLVTPAHIELEIVTGV